MAEKEGKHITPENATFCDWEPFDGENYAQLLGTLDLVYLSSYTVSMFFSGHAADKFHLRYFLSIGSILCGIATASFGFGYFLNIHSYAFYLVVQLIGGIFQASGWPAVVACMGNWFGKASRGLFMGIWNAHTSVGNILGSVVAGAFVDSAWGWSFIVPGLMMTTCGILIFLFLLPYPEEVGIVRSDGTLKDFSYTIQSTDDVATSCSDTSVLHGSASQLLNESSPHSKTVPLLTALRVPGVIEYSLSLLFAKFVSYTFLFWLPNYIRDAGHFDPSAAADLSAIFDLGGIFGGILAGFISDQTAASATVCVGMLICGIPTLYLYYAFGAYSLAHCIGLLIPLGLFVNGPYALITTAVSADLGTHPSLQSNARALATVTGIIDGTGSVGAALGPLVCGLLQSHGWHSVFFVLMGACAVSALLLLRRVRKELFLYRRQHQPILDTTVV